MSTFIGGSVRPRVNVTVKVRGDNTVFQARQIADRLMDLAPILDKIPEQVIFPSVERSFSAQGRPPWRFNGYQSNPPMVKSGLMKQGLTSRGGGLNTIRVNKNTLSFELNPGPYITNSRRGKQGKSPGVFYPGIHQYGGERHNQNIVLNLQEEDIFRIEQMLSDYVTEGKL
jgi:phage gpG-like protein